MKKAVLKTLVVEGFRSCQKPVKLVLDDKGITLIKGINGAGKTTMLSALTWVLFKTNLYETNNDAVATWKHQRLPEYRGTRVVQTMTIDDELDVMVARHLDFKGKTKGLAAGSKLMIFTKPSSEVRDFEQGDLLNTEQHKGDMQVYINELLGMDERTFTNAILFGQRMARLVSATNEEKRKLFETIFDLSFIAGAKEKAAARKTELDNALVKIKNVLNQQKSSKAIHEATLLKDTAILATFETNKAANVATETQTHSNAVEDRKKCEKTLKDLGKKPEADKAALQIAQTTLTTARTTYNKAVETLDASQRLERRYIAEIDDSTKKEAGYTTDLTEVATKCPTCTKPLNAAEVTKAKQVIQDKIAKEQEVRTKLNELLTALQANIKKETTAVTKAKAEVDAADKALTALRTDEQTFNTKLAAYNNAVTAVDYAKKHEANCKVALDKANEAKAPDVNLAATQKLIDDLAASITKLEIKQPLVEAELGRVKWWNDKGFGSSGIKAFVFNAMLTQLNEYAKKYAARLGLRVVFSVDLSKASRPFITTCYKDGHEVTYADLSGGQKQRIDICLAFAVHDVVSHVSNINVLFMDEIFEGLDDEGIETAFDLIRTKAGDGKSVFVITHASMLDSLNTKSIYVEQDEDKSTYLA